MTLSPCLKTFCSAFQVILAAQLRIHTHVTVVFTHIHTFAQRVFGVYTVCVPSLLHVIHVRFCCIYPLLLETAGHYVLQQHDQEHLFFLHKILMRHKVPF